MNRWPAMVCSSSIPGVQLYGLTGAICLSTVYSGGAGGVRLHEELGGWVRGLEIVGGGAVEYVGGANERGYSRRRPTLEPRAWRGRKDLPMWSTNTTRRAYLFSCGRGLGGGRDVAARAGSRGGSRNGRQNAGERGMRIVAESG